MVEITDLEKIVLINIAENEMTPSNGEVPESVDDVSIWTESIEEGGPLSGPRGKSLSGVLSSLTKKGLTFHYEDKKHPEDSSTWFTDKGFEVYKTFNR